MRTRKEIEDAVYKAVEKYPDYAASTVGIVYGQLEVLLDIRDLLSKMPMEKKEKGVHNP